MYLTQVAPSWKNIATCQLTQSTKVSPRDRCVHCIIVVPWDSHGVYNGQERIPGKPK